MARKKENRHSVRAKIHERGIIHYFAKALQTNVRTDERTHGRTNQGTKNELFHLNRSYTVELFHVLFSTIVFFFAEFCMESDRRDQFSGTARPDWTNH